MALVKKKWGYWQRVWIQILPPWPTVKCSRRVQAGPMDDSVT